MKNNLIFFLQSQFNFTHLESERIIYCIQVIIEELSKLVILLLISFPLGHTNKVLIVTIVLLSIRCNCGGLHFSNYINCFLFTTIFYASAIVLSYYPLPNSILSLGLLISLGIFAITGPITSPMRPRLSPREVQKYSRRVTLFLIIYSTALILLESLPYRNLIYWVIVLQIFQLLCARITQKGEVYEKVYDTKDL